jgi:hypothetical protein
MPPETLETSEMEWPRRSGNLREAPALWQSPYSEILIESMIAWASASTSAGVCA